MITCTFTPDCGTEHPSVFSLTGHLAQVHQVAAEEALPKAREIAAAQKPEPPTPEEEPPPMANCKRCGKPGHYAKTCTETPAPRAAKPAKAAKRTKRTGGGTRSPSKPEPAVPRDSVSVIDAAIEDLERRVGILRQAREILA